ncbi:MAG: hypothetical protein LUE12_07545 [Ruminococcus sp.]|nr:hypothetical protein [Ruminococcus sp.]
MTCFKKRIVAIGAAMMMAVSMTNFGVSANTKTGTLSGYSVKGTSKVTATTGSSSTSTSANTTARVTGTYSYVNTSTLKTGQVSKSNGYMYSASVSFSAPSGCRSVKEKATHSVTYSSQSWSASTSATY